MPFLDFQLKGITATARGISAIGPRVETRMRGVLRAVAESRLTEMKQRTPVRDGALRSSLHVTGPRPTVAGGPSAPYAAVQHEDTTLRHTTGQAKFIESVVFEESTAMVAEIAAAIRKGPIQPVDATVSESVTAGVR